jgi:hypothetical protein
MIGFFVKSHQDFAFALNAAKPPFLQKTEEMCLLNEVLPHLQNFG